MPTETAPLAPATPPADRSQTRVVVSVSPGIKGPVPRDANARFMPGHGGVIGAGRKVGLAQRVREMVDFDEAIKTLVAIAWGPLAATARAADRLKAIEILMDRGFGKAAQVIDIKSDDSGITASVRALPTERLVRTVEAMRALAEARDANVDEADGEPES